MTTRRHFLQMATLSAAATGLGSKVRASGKKTAAKAADLQIGIAGYTFLKFSVDQSIAMMKRTGVMTLSIKDFHLPLDSSSETVNAVLEKFRSNGITIYAAGVIYMKTREEVDRAFDYAKKLGIGMIVGVPNPDLLPYTEQKVRANNIRVAIHNHGPEDKLYPSPADVYDKISQMDPRVGLCLDIGHSLRAGTDPVKAITDYGPRIFDLHIKDLASAAKDAKAIELGRGVMNIPGVVKALNEIGYAGKCSIEHEMDMTDPLPGIAEAAGYFRGVLKTINA